MKLIKIGAACINQTPLDWDGNVKNIKQVISTAHSNNVNLLLLPELCVTGYGCEDSFFMPHVLDRAMECLQDISRFIQEFNSNYLSSICVAFGTPLLHDGAIYNCCYITDGSNEVFIPKQNLCADGVHYEPRWFKAWKKGRVDRVPQKYSIVGDTIVTLRCGSDRVKIGVEICEDAWVHDRPGISLASRGAEIIINPSASHFSFGKHRTRRVLVEESSRAFNCAYVYANLLGNEAGRVVYDGDTYIASQGKIVAEGRRLSFNSYELTTAVIDLDKNNVRRWQSHHDSFVQDDPVCLGNYNCTDKVETQYVPSDTPVRYKYGRYLDVNNDEYDAFTKAVSLGLWDYMRKTCSKGFMLSLSGGADSSAVACLVRSMVITAYNECKNFSFILFDYVGVDAGKIAKNSNSNEDIVREICRQLLTCVYQATDNSSTETELAASNLATAIGATFHTIDIQPIVDEYKKASEMMLERELSWETDDVALQNIQARVRAPSVWMMANIKGSLLLSTSNRSEAAVGYATMDGDTCGGLSPIAGVSKEFLLLWLEDYHSSEAAKTQFNGLVNVVRLKPTAELRPQEQNQTDEDDLMPYPILNKIEVMAVKNKMSPKEIRDILLESGVDKATEYVVRFFELFTRNQWKRERYAPSFHLDDESLDPKTFYRFPILNSGFKKELEELKND